MSSSADLHPDQAEHDANDRQAHGGGAQPEVVADHVHHQGGDEGEDRHRSPADGESDDLVVGVEVRGFGVGALVHLASLRSSYSRMIERRQGDLFASGAEALVNPVNCVGVMGKGLALQFRKAFPGNFEAYKAACDRGELRPGVMLVHDRGASADPRYVVNFPTKRHWRSRSRMEDVEAGLAALVEEVRSRGIGSIAIPALGSGLGGLEWEDVRARIEAAFDGLPEVLVLLFEPL